MSAGRPLPGRIGSVSLLVLAVALFGCSDPPVVTAAGARAANAATPSASGSSSAAAPAGSAASPLPKVEVQEAEFSESERSRDPFRSFARNFVQDTKARVHSQREVILG